MQNKAKDKGGAGAAVRYNKTKRACYLGFVTQAIVANFTPLLFLIFHREYQIAERSGCSWC